MSLKHGMYGTPTYRSWQYMKKRCLNPNAHAFERYGGRGITFCKAWESFNQFLKDMGEKPKGTTLERTNNNGNYEPDNCCWATYYQQANNRRNNRPVEINGEVKNISQWCRQFGIARTVVANREHRYGWNIKEAICTPLGEKPTQSWRWIFKKIPPTPSKPRNTNTTMKKQKRKQGLSQMQAMLHQSP